jgi:hypothetical protein
MLCVPGKTFKKINEDHESRLCCEVMNYANRERRKRRWTVLLLRRNREIKHSVRIDFLHREEVFCDDGI